MIVNFKNYRTANSSIITTASAARKLKQTFTEDEIISEYNRGYSEGYSAGYDAALRSLSDSFEESEYTSGAYEYIENDEFGTYGLSDTYYDLDEAEPYEPSLRTKLLQSGIYVALGIAFVIAMKVMYMI